MKAAIVVAVGIMFMLAACSKPTAPAVVVIVGPQVATTQLEAMGAVKVAPSPKVDVTKPVVKSSDKSVKTSKPETKSASKKVSAKLEAAAYEKALANKQYARCLLRAVDAKINKDVELGKIRDFGNVLKSGVCKDGMPRG